MPVLPPIRIAAIVLAAGESKRFPSQNKLLVKIENKSILERTAAAITATPVTKTIFVTGEDHEKFKNMLSSYNLICIQNPCFNQGMGSSLAFAASSINKDEFHGILICLADLAFLKSDTINTVISAFSNSSRNHIVAPEYKGRLGHPIIFPQRLLSQLSQQSGDQGAKSILQNEERSLIRIPVDTDTIYRDIDSPRDL